MSNKAYGKMSDQEKREDYWDSVKTTAEIALREKKEEDRPLRESVWEGVDSSQWIIYTSRNLDVLRLGESEPIADHLWQDADNWREAIQGMAFDVMKQDVMEKVEELKEKKLNEVA